MRSLTILTWHVHGSYLYYLARCGHELILPVKDGRPEGYGGRSGNFAWPPNVREVRSERVRDLDVDLVLFQSRRNYCEDQQVLSDSQRRGPRIYLEHDPPQQHPTNTKHIVDDPNVLVVHVTSFNQLMWDNGRAPTRVIEHGVAVPDDVRYSPAVPRAVTVVNGLPTRGRRLGADIYERARRAVPIDLVGMQSETYGGAGDLPLADLWRYEASRRLFFNPIRYTSMPLSVCEAMMIGLPVVALATAEMATVLENGYSGYADTSPDRLIDVMHDLLHDQHELHRLSAGARRTALQRFNITRFVDDWNRTFADVCGIERASRRYASASIEEAL